MTTGIDTFATCGVLTASRWRSPVSYVRGGDTDHEVRPRPDDRVGSRTTQVPGIRSRHARWCRAPRRVRLAEQVDRDKPVQAAAAGKGAGKSVDSRMARLRGARHKGSDQRPAR